MHWKIQALTKTGRIINKTVEGDIDDIRNDAQSDDLEILNMDADYLAWVQSFYLKRCLSTAALANFFVDFARSQNSGLSLSESIDSLKQTCDNSVLKEGLKIISHSINDGRSLKEAFENSKCFPKIVMVSLSAAEKSGSIPEISGILGNYFKFRNNNNKRILGSLVYPAAVFCALTAASVIISINLVPQLAKILPASSVNNWGTKILLAYAIFMKSFWWLALLLPVVLLVGVRYVWIEYKEPLAGMLYQLPVLGNALKDLEFSRLFLNLYVYQKSGVPIIETISHIYHDDQSYINTRLLGIRDRIIKGQSIGEAFKSDEFFPGFIWRNLAKGQKSGDLIKYLQETYHFYDDKSKDSIQAAVALINPVLLSLAIAFLGFIIGNFFLPIYRNMATMGGMFR